MNRVCIFCGSAVGARPEYAEAARGVVTELARHGLGLVFGGGSVGLMGVLADAALATGLEVIGVIPRPLATRELAHRGVTELRLVDSMHERKATMASLADAFVALPGGFGTLEETLEIITWAQLGIHAKPVGVLNVAGYFEGLLQFIGHAVAEEFIRRDYLDLLVVADSPADLLTLLTHWQPPSFPRPWLAPTQT